MTRRACAALVPVLLAGLALARADDRPEPARLEPTAPEGSPAGELDSLLHDDLGAGTAGTVPVALLEALCVRDPERFGSTPDELYERFGYLRVRGSELPVGVFETEALGARLRGYNCLACHAGEEDGRLVVGAPNRTLDFVGFYVAVLGTTRAIVREADCPASAVLELERAASRYARRHGRHLSVGDAAGIAFAAANAARMKDREAEPPYGPGRTVVTASYRRLRFHMGPGPHAPVKVPDLFGVRARTNLLWTGNERYGPGTSPEEKIARNGLLVPWVQLDPITQRPAPDDAIVARLDRHRRMARLLVRSAPPTSPAPSGEGRPLHERGRAVFERTCAKCHGTYEQVESDGRLATRVREYEEKLVPVEKVATDPNYEATNDAEFVRNVGRTAIGRLYDKTEVGGCYVPRPLLGLRLRAPYLHNGSVPSLRALLTRPEDRPARFWVGRDAAVDPGGVGLGTGEPTGPRAQLRETTHPGERAVGHPFGTTLEEAEKRALLEYLRTL